MYSNDKLMHSLMCFKECCQVPPSPQLLLQIYVTFKSLKKERKLPENFTFENYLAVWRSSRRAENFVGLDDGKTEHGASSEAQLIDRPVNKLKGEVKTLVLLVDFPDLPHMPGKTTSYYEQMLFGDLDAFPTGSMAEYYRKISNYNRSKGTIGVNISGHVHGWFRLPQNSEFYAGGNSGMGSYPSNVQRMAEDAIEIALANGVEIGEEYDVFREGTVTALFIIHAGAGAEVSGEKSDLWSLKWLLSKPKRVPGGPKINTFLTVPEDCQVGVCAHEWGHLAGRWADFYDTGKIKNSLSNGLGNYCLMASGSWNNNGVTPSFPNGMLRMFHNWIEPLVLSESRSHIEILPASEGGSIVIIPYSSSRRQDSLAYLFVEYRRKKDQDTFLTDEGIAIYSVDELIDNVNNESLLAIELIQADGRRDLGKTFSQGNAGDNSDLYPFIDTEGRVVNVVGKGTTPQLLAPDGKWTGVTITVHGSAGDASMFIDVSM